MNKMTSLTYRKISFSFFHFFSSQMYGVFAVDDLGKPLCNNILWSDARAQGEERFIKEKYNYIRLAEETGCPVNSIYPLSKILWIKNNRPVIYANARRFISIKDYVIHHLTGKWVSDYSMLSATGLFDIGSLQWSEYALSIIGLDSSHFPEPIPDEEKLAFSNVELLIEWHLSPETVVIPGAGDGPLANLGSGACHVGDVNIDLGTSGAIRTIVNAAPRDGKSGLWSYCLAEGTWVYGGILTNVGNAYSWLEENIVEFERGTDKSEALNRMDSFAENVPAGAEGLLFLPYLRAPRSPYWNSKIKSVIYGMTPSMNLGHVIRALLEAFAYDLSFILDSIGRQSKITDHILFTGGLSKSKLLCRILSDVTGRIIRVPECNEGSIRGAAIIGLKALGVLDSLSFPGHAEHFEDFYPDALNKATYESSRKRYLALVKATELLEL